MALLGRRLFTSHPSRGESNVVSALTPSVESFLLFSGAGTYHSGGFFPILSSAATMEDLAEEAEREFANEISPVNDSKQVANIDHHPENLAPPIVNHEYSESKCKVNDKEITGIIEVIATTGMFRHDWDTLKSLLSCQLKQVLAEYPESQTIAGPEPQQSSLPSELYTELVKRFDEELLSFVEGPPFTLQRICEILLNARHIYPKLSKLALALEKNLSVTSTLSISTDPYPGAVRDHQPEDAQQSVRGIGDKCTGNEHIQEQHDPAQNGCPSGGGDADQEMIEAQGNEENLNSDMEMHDKIVERSGAALS